MTEPHPLSADEVPLAGALCAAAFVDDPGYQHLFGAAVAPSLRFLAPRLLRMRLGAGAKSLALRAPRGEPVALVVHAGDHVRLGPLTYLRHGLLRAPAALGLSTTRTLLHADRQLHRLKNLGRPPRGVELLTVAVHPDHQGQGLGTQLLERAVEALGAEPLWLVTTNARRVALYERAGFRITAQTSLLAAFTALVMVREPTG